MVPRFIYFDLGNVLLCFSRERQLTQMAEVTGLEAGAVRVALMDSGLNHLYESGQLSSQEFFQRFCQASGADCDYQQLLRAGSDIFWPNCSIIPLISSLWSVGYPSGIVSNTCVAHWEWIIGEQYGIVPAYFAPIILSYEVGAMKPAREIYEAAAEKAGVDPEEIFFVDDIEENVSAARQFGFDAVLYTTTAKLVSELRQRGLKFNY